MIDTDLEAVVWADLVPVSDIVVEDCENGTVIVNKETARAGETVEVTITPATDYKVDTVVITDAQGNTVAFENGSFKMPASAVTVVVTFKEHVPTYAVNVDVIGNGTVKLDKAEYEAGETVTINIKHPDGYMLYSLEVVDANGKPVAVKACTFVMPKGGATVYVEIVNDIPLPAKVYFEANVALEGAELEAGLFQFELSYLYKDSTIKVQTLKNSADGKIKFAPIAFYSPCEHTFYIKQVACNAEGVEYDATVYEIKVKVTYDKAGVLVATVAQTAVDFVNTAK
jgi:pilin isopeptide linkage protein